MVLQFYTCKTYYSICYYAYDSNLYTFKVSSFFRGDMRQSWRVLETFVVVRSSGYVHGYLKYFNSYNHLT